MTTVKQASIDLTLTDGVTEGVLEDSAGGIMTVSQNTRLTKLKGTLSRCPEPATINTNPGKCGALVIGGRDNVCAYFEGGAHQRISGVESSLVVGAAAGTAGANAYYPYPLVEGGALGGGAVGLAPATCFDALGQQWFVASRIVSGDTLGTSKIGLFASVILNGADVITPTIFATQAGIALWVGVTPCTGGVIVWYEGATGISAVRLSTTGTALNIGAPTTFYSPLYASPLAGIMQADVTSDGANTAYLLTRDSVSPTTLVLAKIDLTTMLTTNAAIFTGKVANTAPLLFLAVTLMSAGGTDYVAVASSEGAGVTFQAVCVTSTLSTVWSLTGAGRYGPVAVQPWFSGTNKFVVFATSLTGTAIGVNASGVIFDTYDLATGVYQGTSYAYWYGLQSQGAAHQPAGSTDVFPYFPLFARWGQGGSPPTVLGDPNPTFFMDTPSVEVVTPFSPTILTPVMRFGVDRVSQYSSVFYNSKLAAVSPTGLMCFTYIADRYDQPSQSNRLFASRYVVFNMRPATQPSTAVDTGNVSMIGSGMPAVWDGLETTEYCPFHRPKIQVNTTGGDGDTLTGTISFSAVVSWRDSFGNVRRSAPALPQKVVFSGTKAQIFVTMPLTMRQGRRQELFDIIVYATVPAGAVFIAIDARTITREQLGCWQFNTIYGALLGDVELYSQFVGIQPLQPECPPPIWDIRSIAGRLWIIDAEDRYRLLPSMLKQEGVAFEFNSNLQIVNFDQQYGKLVAIADVGGNPIAFAERGLWQIDGYGPDNSGQGGSFDDPRLISNMGCRARHTVCQVPGVGVMFQAQDGRFCLLAGGMKRFETFGVYDVQAPTVHLLQNEVIYPLTDGSGYVVYNWVADGWTHWVNPVALVPTMCATLQSSARSRTYQAVIAGDGTCSLVYLDSDNASSGTTRPIQAKRAWIAPEAPQGDCTFGEVWLQAVYASAHGVRLRAEFDYNPANFVQREWTAAEIALLVRGGRYTLGLNCQAPQARTVDVTVTELDGGGAGDAMQPVGLTVTYGVSPGLRRISLLNGALK